MGNEKGGGSVKTLILIGCIIIALLIGVIVFLLIPKDGQQEESRNVVVTQDNVEEVIEQMEVKEPVQPGYFETSMTNEWHFADGKSASKDAYVANVEGNTNDIFFDVVLAEDESHFVYKSPVLQRGAYIEDIVLDEDLDPGVYNCVMIYHLVDDDQNTVSTLRIAITIYVEG
jgi:hypothetical protein